MVLQQCMMVNNILSGEALWVFQQTPNKVVTKLKKTKNWLCKVWRSISFLQKCYNSRKDTQSGMCLIPNTSRYESQSFMSTRLMSTLITYLHSGWLKDYNMTKWLNFSSSNFSTSGRNKYLFRFSTWPPRLLMISYSYVNRLKTVLVDLLLESYFRFLIGLPCGTYGEFSLMDQLLRLWFVCDNSWQEDCVLVTFTEFHL